MNKIIFVLCVLHISYIFANESIVIKKAERKIDLTTQLVKISNRLTLESTSNVKSFFYALSNDEAENLSFITATSSGNSELDIVVEKSEDGKNQYKIILKDSLAAGKSTTIDVELVLSHTIHPYPKSISQGEKQLMQFDGNHYIYSPYYISTQTTVVLVSSNVISYSRLKPVSHMEAAITYGPYKDVYPFSFDEMKIHYENNSPFLTITNLERLIEVSHWGNVAVEETIDLYHSGAKLKGSFSRYDYQREHNFFSSIKLFKTVLPASAKDVYYRDDIGNISTSHMRLQDDAVEIDIRPRFPLFGGWKTKYIIGYNVPSYEYHYSLGNQYLLKMRVIDHIFDDMVIDNVLVRIILPEGVSNIELQTPYDIKRHSDELHFTYLDVGGRPVVVLSKKNLVENHIQYFYLTYTFPAYRMLFEPLLVTAAFFLLFFTVIIYVRLDFTISKDEAAETKMRISSQCELVHNHNDRRAAQYEKLESEIQKLKSTKDIAQAQTSTKKIFSLIKEETSKISELASKIRPDSVEYSDKVQDLQKQDKAIFECLQQQYSAVEKMVGGKMNKQAFMESSNSTQKKKEVAVEKMKMALAAI